MRGWLIGGALLGGVMAMVIGCNDPNGGDAQSAGDVAGAPAGSGAASSTLAVATDGSLPAGFPADLLRPYPGAEIARAATGADGSMLELTVQKPITDVMEFYRQYLDGLGWQTAGVHDTGASSVMSFTNGERTISLTTTDNNGTTLASLVINSGGIDETVPPPADLMPDLVTLPEGFPADIIPGYPDSTWEKATLDDKEAVLEERTPDSATQVIDFYTAHFKTVGMELSQDVTVENNRFVSFSRPSGEPGAVGMLLRPGSGGKTVVRVTYEFNWLPAGKK